MTTLAMMNQKRLNPAILLGVAFVACFVIALVVSHREASPGQNIAGRPGFTLAAAPLLSSNRIADTRSFHRQSFVRPVAASVEPLFRSPAGLTNTVREVQFASSSVRRADGHRSGGR